MYYRLFYEEDEREGQKEPASKKEEIEVLIKRIVSLERDVKSGVSGNRFEFEGSEVPLHEEDYHVGSAEAEGETEK